MSTNSAYELGGPSNALKSLLGRETGRLGLALAGDLYSFRLALRIAQVEVWRFGMVRF